MITPAQVTKARKEFALALDDAEQSYRRYVGEQLDLALRRVRLHLNKIIFISTALKGGFIEPDAAIDWLMEDHTLDYIDPQEPDHDR